MYRKKVSLEDELNSFLDKWDVKQLISFLKDTVSIIELYNVNEEDDWLKARVDDPEDIKNVRLIRMTYLLSRIADNHAGVLCHLKMNFNGLWKRIDKAGRENKE
jgi:hypothetical protein